MTDALAVLFDGSGQKDRGMYRRCVRKGRITTPAGSAFGRAMQNSPCCRSWWAPLSHG